MLPLVADDGRHQRRHERREVAASFTRGLFICD